MKSNQQGMVLLSFILILGLSSLLLLCQFERFIGFHKIVNQTKLEQLLFHDLEQALHALIHTPLNSRQGEISLNHHLIRYKIDYLGLFPCLVMGSESPSAHWQLRLETNNLGIQVRVATLAQSKTTCKGPFLRQIKPGIQTWITYGNQS